MFVYVFNENSILILFVLHSIFNDLNRVVEHLDVPESDNFHHCDDRDEQQEPVEELFHEAFELNKESCNQVPDQEDHCYFLSV